MNMNTPEFYNPNEKPHDIDPSMPAFRFSGEEKKELLEKGVTEEEIRQKEVEATNKLARKVIEEEQERAA
jgi:hypothetical protein